jgi:hypothetical protein
MRKKDKDIIWANMLGKDHSDQDADYITLNF